MITNVNQNIVSLLVSISILIPFVCVIIFVFRLMYTIYKIKKNTEISFHNKERQKVISRAPKYFRDWVENGQSNEAQYKSGNADVNDGIEMMKTGIHLAAHVHENKSEDFVKEAKEPKGTLKSKSFSIDAFTEDGQNELVGDESN
eukprot:499120_1